MTNLIRIIIILIMTSLLSSCLTVEQARKKRVENVPVNQRSYMIGKYIVTCEPDKDECNQGFNSLSVKYRSKENPEYTNRIDSVYGSSIFGDDTKVDFVSIKKQEKGFYFCQSMKPGTYSLYSYEFYNFAGGGSGYYIRDDKQFDLPFSLGAGEAVYIGNLKLTTTKGENFFGAEVSGPGILIISEGDKHDIEMAIKKCSVNIHSQSVKIQLPEAKDGKKTSLVIYK